MESFEGKVFLLWFHHFSTTVDEQLRLRSFTVNRWWFLFHILFSSGFMYQLLLHFKELYVLNVEKIWMNKRSLTVKRWRIKRQKPEVLLLRLFTARSDVKRRLLSVCYCSAFVPSLLHQSVYLFYENGGHKAIRGGGNDTWALALAQRWEEAFWLGHGFPHRWQFHQTQINDHIYRWFITARAPYKHRASVWTRYVMFSERAQY